MRRLAVSLVFILAIAPVVGIAQDRSSYADRPLAEVLADLQHLGLQLVFSTAVVTPSMVVEREPRGEDPRSILDQLLEPHGLRAEDGPGGTILILVATAGKTVPATG